MFHLCAGNEPDSNTQNVNETKPLDNNGTDSSKLDYNETDSNTLNHSELETLSDALKGGFQTGALEEALGVEIAEVKVSAPVPPVNDSSWNAFAETAANTTGSNEELRKATQIVAEWSNTQQQEGATFSTDVLVKFLDAEVCTCTFCFRIWELLFASVLRLCNKCMHLLKL